MEIITGNACQAYLSATEEIIRLGKLYCLNIQFDITEKSTSDDVSLAIAFDAAFAGKTGWKGGRQLPWRNWLINSGFPDDIYKEHGNDLVSTIKDSRVWDINFQSHSTHHNFFGRICRPLNDDGDSYASYLLERFRDKKLRSHPNFYFDVERTEWIWEELIKNHTQPKTGRAAATCCTNMFFRWDTVANRLIVGWIIKHCAFTHLYQDIYSPQLIARALCKELSLEYNALICVFFVSAFMDDKKAAKKIFSEYNKDMEG